MCIFVYLTPFANKHILSAITQELCKHDAHGNQLKTQITIEFTIMSVAKASHADVAKSNIEEVVLQGGNALDHTKPVPSSFEHMQGLVDSSATVTCNVNFVSNNWGPFLQKIKLFIEIVGTIAEVRHRANQLRGF